MSHGKETPRQKMIGMMYLVLTAMLAMNVAAEVLDAFVLVEDGLTQTTKSFRIKNEKLYNQIDQANLINPTKVGPWKEKSDEVKNKAQELIKYVQDLKLEVIKVAEKETSAAIDGENVLPKYIGKKGDLNAGPQVLIGSERNGKAYDLKNKIIDFREYVLSIIDENKAPQLVESINNILNTEDPEPEPKKAAQTWETARFDHLPLVAVFPQLTKVQVDILNIEAEVVSYLLQQVDAGDFKVNKLDAIVIPSSSYVIQGTDFNAEVFLAASDTTQNPKIFIGRYETYTTEDGFEDYRMVGSYDELPIEGGRGILTRKASTIGTVSWQGLLEVTAPNGTKIRKPFDHQYEVAKPNVVISPTRMNVFYLAVDNPVDISISGISMDKITATMPKGGKIRRAGNNFIVNPPQSATCEIAVTAEIDGTRRPMGSQSFRVKPVPPPEPSVDGVASKRVAKNVLASALYVAAKMPPDFDFDMKFTVTGFTVSAVVGGFTDDKVSKSQMLTDDQKRLIGSLRSGQVVSFTNIKAVGPDGSIRELNDLVFRIL